MADLDSDHTEPLLPGFRIPVTAVFDGSVALRYDIAPDGRQLVFQSPDRDGKNRLWLAPLDRRSPPRQPIPAVEGEEPLFGPDGEIFFRKVEGTSNFLFYSVRADGAGLRKATESMVVNLFGAYPNRKVALDWHGAVRRR